MTLTIGVKVLTGKLKFEEIIDERGESPTAIAKRLGEIEERDAKARDAIEERDAKARDAIEQRKKDGQEFSQERTTDLKNLLRFLGIAEVMSQALQSFGCYKDETLAYDHYEYGQPKRVGAWLVDKSHYLFTPNSDPDLSPTLHYAMAGTSINYLTRQWNNRSYDYTLSRFAVVLSQGETTKEQPVLWTGELPQTPFKSRVVIRSNFREILDLAVDMQDNRMLFADKTIDPHVIPRVISEGLVISDHEAHGRESQDVVINGLTHFADQRYIPAAQQVAPYPDY